MKTRREGLGLRFGREIDGHEDCIFVMVVSVPDGLVLIGIKPRTYFDHRCGKFSIAYPDRDAVHSPLHAFVEATMDLVQMLGRELLTNILGSLDLKTRDLPSQSWLSRVFDTLAQGLRSYRITAKASFQIAAQRPTDRSKIRIKDVPLSSRRSRSRFPSDRTGCFREATKERSSNGVLVFTGCSVCGGAASSESKLTKKCSGEVTSGFHLH